MAVRPQDFKTFDQVLSKAYDNWIEIKNTNDRESEESGVPIPAAADKLRREAYLHWESLSNINQYIKPAKQSLTAQQLLDRVKKETEKSSAATTIQDRCDKTPNDTCLTETMAEHMFMTWYREEKPWSGPPGASGKSGLHFTSTPLQIICLSSMIGTRVRPAVGN
ncbi:hypothetical protein LTS10_000309 [Elasticomyces elasticus]|nr:hypothetical protein LTS10_000309 [Elasticomyces elasticus]